MRKNLYVVIEKDMVKSNTQPENGLCFFSSMLSYQDLPPIEQILTILGFHLDETRPDGIIIVEIKDQNTLDLDNNIDGVYSKLATALESLSAIKELADKSWDMTDSDVVEKLQNIDTKIDLLSKVPDNTKNNS